MPLSLSIISSYLEGSVVGGEEVEVEVDDAGREECVASEFCCCSGSGAGGRRVALWGSGESDLLLRGCFRRRMKNSPEKAMYWSTSACMVCLERRSIPNVSISRVFDTED